MTKHIFKALSALLVMTFVLCGVSCKKQPADYAIKSLTTVAQSLNQKCPITQKNGSTLVSVECVDGQLVYTCQVPSSVLHSISKSDAREQLLSSMNDKVMEVLVRGNCAVVYKYTSDKDSVLVTIEPSEIEEAFKEAHANDSTNTK